jgi:hypothetical protein
MRLAAAMLICAFGILVPVPVMACSCRPPTLASVKALSDVALEGRVLKTWVVGSEISGRRYATIRVTSTIKGRLPRIIRVVTRTDSAACGVNFEVGQRVRFGASVEGRNYSTGLCSQF